MSTHNIRFYGEIRKLSQNYHCMLLHIKSSGLSLRFLFVKGFYIFTPNIWMSFLIMFASWPW